MVDLKLHAKAGEMGPVNDAIVNDIVMRLQHRSFLEESSLCAEAAEALKRQTLAWAAWRGLASEWQGMALRNIDAVRDAECERDAMRAMLAQAETDCTTLRADRDALREAIAPFAAIAPSTFRLPDGSESYIVLLKSHFADPTAFTGADLARARAAYEPVGTNLFTYPQAKAMLEHVLAQASADHIVDANKMMPRKGSNENE